MVKNVKSGSLTTHHTSINVATTIAVYGHLRPHEFCYNATPDTTVRTRIIPTPPKIQSEQNYYNVLTLLCSIFGGVGIINATVVLLGCLAVCRMRLFGITLMVYFSIFRLMTVLGLTSMVVLYGLLIMLLTGGMDILSVRNGCHTHNLAN